MNNFHKWNIEENAFQTASSARQVKYETRWKDAWKNRKLRVVWFGWNLTYFIWKNLVWWFRYKQKILKFDEKIIETELNFVNTPPPYDFIYFLINFSGQLLKTLKTCLNQEMSSLFMFSLQKAFKATWKT